MLLRSSSAPILCSLLPYSKESSPEPEQILHLPRAVSVLSLNQTLLENDLHSNNKTPSPMRKNCVPRSSKVLRNHQHSSSSTTKIKERGSDEVKEEENCIVEARASSIQGIFSCSGLDKGVMHHHDQENSVNGELTCGGGRGSNGGNGRGWDYFSEGNNSNNHGRDRTNAYYQNMIEANPNDSLLLGNYAKFLKEVCGDYPKAKEFLERAILATPSGDGHVLSLYADLVWQTEKNPDRAEGYFDQAIKSSPDDCYVMASYAKFLWEAEEEEDDRECMNDKSEENQTCIHDHHDDLFQGTIHHPNLTAAS